MAVGFLGGGLQKLFRAAGCKQISRFERIKRSQVPKADESFRGESSKFVKGSIRDDGDGAAPVSVGSSASRRAIFPGGPVR
jgi:hypothetical protein